jgi:hypothetical protein
MRSGHLTTKRPSFEAWLVIALVAVGGTVETEARADVSSADKAAAQALFDQGKDLLARGNAADACPKLEESHRLDPTSGTLINLADCYERSGKLATAWTTFLQAAPAAKAAGHLEREQVARDRASALAPRLPKIVINVSAEVADLEIRRDGLLVGKGQWGAPIPADLGQHRVTAFLPGRKTWESSVTLRSEGETQVVLVPSFDTFAPPVAASPPAAAERGGLGAQRIAALVAGGVGVGGMIAGTAFGLASQSKGNEADDHCAGSICRDQIGVDLRAEALRAGNMSTAGFVVGALGLAGGALLWFTASDDAGRSSGPRVGLGLGTVNLTKSW